MVCFLVHSQEEEAVPTQLCSWRDRTESRALGVALGKSLVTLTRNFSETLGAEMQLECVEQRLCSKEAREMSRDNSRRVAVKDI